MFKPTIFKSSKYLTRNMSSWRRHVLEKEKRKAETEKQKVETENVNKIVNEMNELKNEIFCVSLCIAWSSVGIMYCIRNK